MINSELEYLKISLSQPINNHAYTSSDKPHSPSVTWNAKKAELIELIYSLYHSGCFGDSKLKDIFAALDKAFGISVPKFSHVYTRIKERKLDRCIFLGKLCCNLKHAMDQKGR